MSRSSVRVVGTGDSLRECSTRAAREYVRAVRRRMQAEVERHGERAKQSGSYRRLQDGISPEALRRSWPDADIEAALDE
jgi:hypothetical protein